MRIAQTYQPDALHGNTWIEVQSGTKAVRTLRTALLGLIYALAQASSDRRGLLLLVDPGISPARIEEEWAKVRSVFRRDLASRFSLVMVKDGQYRGFPDDPSPDLMEVLKELVSKVPGPLVEKLPPKNNHHELLKILLRAWFLNEGPMTTGRLGKIAGCSYPTVVSNLTRLGDMIRRHSDRRVELAQFPREDWRKLVANSEAARATMYFADRSGQPRSVESLLGRFRQKKRRDVAVGGILGTGHHFAELDLVGNPRLDLTVHCPGPSADTGLVESLDPALQRTVDRREPVRLVLHFLRRSESFFEHESKDRVWADPVECLLDLHDARLEAQAREFLENLIERRRKA